MKECSDKCKGGCDDLKWCRMIALCIITVFLSISGYFFNEINKINEKINAINSDSQLRLTKIEIELVQSKALLLEIREQVKKR